MRTKQEIIEVLKNTDTVIARLTGVGEEVLCSTQQLHEMLEPKKLRTKQEYQDALDVLTYRSNRWLSNVYKQFMKEEKERIELANNLLQELIDNLKESDEKINR